MNKYRAWDGEKMVVDGDRWYPRGESRHGRIPYEVQISSIGIHYTKLFDLGQKSVNIDGVDYYSNQDGDGDAVHSEGLELMQCIGRTDMSGVEIYFDSLINVFFTSGDGEHYHDCVYRVVMGSLGIEMRLESLLWQSGGHNQYPLSTTLCERFGSLKVGYFNQENRNVLMIPESFEENRMRGNRWKKNDESMYFKVIGTAQENPELLNAAQENLELLNAATVKDRS
tara:strand:- start:4738 stop:5415 length:678 start_codon:yes stop_codon:yes gene_type:complete